MKKLLSYFSILGLIVFVNSCDKQNTPVEEQVIIPEVFVPEYEICNDLLSFDFLNSQNLRIGSVYVSNNEDNLNVTYQTYDGWKLGEIHLYAGRLEDFPMNVDGTANLGKFPYYLYFNSYLKLYTFEIDIDEFEDDFIVAAHAEVFLLDDAGTVIQSDMAWMIGKPFNTVSRAAYLEYSKRECPSCYVSYTTVLYAGQTIPVGQVNITNDEEFLYVSYHTTDDWFLGSTKLFVGELSNLPVNGAGNPVLGQFPYQQGHDLSVSDYTYTIPLAGLPSCYILAAYADVYKNDGGIVLSEGAWGFGTEFPEASQWGWYYDYCTQVCE